MPKIPKLPLLGYSLKNQHSYIVLDAHTPTTSPILHYTFLQSNLQMLPAYILPSIGNYGFGSQMVRAVGKYLEAVEKLEGKLGDIRGKEIQPSVLQDADVREISGLFVQAKKCIEQQAQKSLDTPSTSIHQLAHLASALNILQMPIWNKILISSTQSYKKTPIQARHLLTESLRSYLDRYSYTTTLKFKKDKFMIRENHLQDVVDFPYFLRVTEESGLLAERDFGGCMELVKSRMLMIQKISKAVNLNFYAIRRQFMGIVPWIIDNLDFLQIDEIIFVYNFYVKISAHTPTLVDKLQDMLLKRLCLQHLPSEAYKQKLCKNLLNTWKQQARYCPRLWNRVIEPYLREIFGKLEGIEDMGLSAYQVQFWNTVAYSLVCCGLAETGFPGKILKVIEKSMPANNKTYQITTQYLNLKAKSKKDSKNLLPTLQPLPSPNPTKIQTIEYNPIQHFWQNMIKQVIPAAQIHRSTYISAFQIDILVQYRSQYFAFEVQGSHYRFGVNQSGKKRVKEEILGWFGIKTITINCQDTQPKIIMRFKLVRDGERYIRRLLEEQFGGDMDDGKGKGKGKEIDSNKFKAKQIV